MSKSRVPETGDSAGTYAGRLVYFFASSRSLRFPGLHASREFFLWLSWRNVFFIFFEVDQTNGPISWIPRLISMRFVGPFTLAINIAIDFLRMLELFYKNLVYLSN